MKIPPQNVTAHIAVSENKNRIYLHIGGMRYSMSLDEGFDIARRLVAAIDEAKGRT